MRVCVSSSAFISQSFSVLLLVLSFQFWVKNNNGQKMWIRRARNAKQAANVAKTQSTPACPSLNPPYTPPFSTIVSSCCGVDSFLLCRSCRVVLCLCFVCLLFPLHKKVIRYAALIPEQSSERSSCVSLLLEAKIFLMSLSLRFYCILSLRETRVFACESVVEMT
jgi:hypothetical protein